MTARTDFETICELVEPEKRLLDIGCGDGELMQLLERNKQLKTFGMEISGQGVSECVAKGLSVVQGDANTDLEVYPESAFDYAVLSRTIQEMHQPRKALEELVRVAPSVILSFKNYGYWRSRLRLFLTGRVPRPGDAQWYEKVTINPCTLQDFVTLCDHSGLEVKAVMRSHKLNRAKPGFLRRQLLNLLAEYVIVVIERKEG